MYRRKASTCPSDRRTPISDAPSRRSRPRPASVFSFGPPSERPGPSARSVRLRGMVGQAGVAPAYLPEPLVRVDPVRVTVVPGDLDGVSSHRFDALGGHVLRHRLGIEDGLSRHLLNAFGALAFQAQEPPREEADVSVCPRNCEVAV